MKIGSVFKNILGPIIKQIKTALKPIITMIGQYLLPILIDLIPTEEISAFAETIAVAVQDLFTAISPLFELFSTIVPLLSFFVTIFQQLIVVLGGEPPLSTEELERKTRYLDEERNELERNRQAYQLFIQQKQQEQQIMSNNNQNILQMNQTAMENAFRYRRPV